VWGFFVAAAAGLEAMVTGETQSVRVELKYCEACGALWLRPHGSHKPYCKRCESVVAELSRTNGRKPAEGERP